MLPLNDTAIVFVNRDFALLLGLLVLFAFGVRVVRRSFPGFLTKPALIRWPVDFIVGGFWEILIIFILRAFFCEMYLIPSGSMQPTVYPGDLVLVNKFAYGIKAPATNTTLIEWGHPEYGDPVVFLDPSQPTVRKMIKRLIARGGDHVKVQGDVVWLNGQQIPRTFLYQSYEYLTPKSPRVETRFYEQQVGQRQFVIESIPALKRSNLDVELTVPQGYYFVLGDNRDNSIDSRYWGLVPERFLCGKAQYVLLSFGKTEGQSNWDRVGGLA